MFTPKVLFVNIDFLKEVELIYQFLFKKELNWEEDILAFHPRLEKVYLLKSKASKISFIKNYLADFRKKEGEKNERQKKLYRRKWKRIEKKALNDLSELIELDWPKSRGRIKAMLSVNPICPRFLEDWSFTIFYKLNTKKAKEVILHESCHFLYFEKWKRVFPKHQKKDLEVPSLGWHLSEIIASILLNDYRIQKILKKKVEFYEEHKQIRIKGVSAPRYFSELYREYQLDQRSFTDFIKQAYTEIKKQKRLFLKN